METDLVISRVVADIPTFILFVLVEMQECEEILFLLDPRDLIIVKIEPVA